MVKHATFVVVFLVVYTHTWMSFVSVFATPATEAQSIFSSISDANSQQGMKGRIREEIELAEALGDYLPRIDDEDDDELYYSDGGDLDKRRARTSKWRLRGSKRSFTDEKRRLRFIKRNYLKDQETGLAPRLRFRDGSNDEKK